jgi:hypothetical protein
MLWMVKKEPAGAGAFNAVYLTASTANISSSRKGANFQMF